MGIKLKNLCWKEWCWSWNSSTLATSCEELTHWKRFWCWEGLGAGGEGDDRGWDGWMASLTRWTWVWVNSGSWWWTESPGVLQFMESQRVRHNWATELTELNHLEETTSTSRNSQCVKRHLIFPKLCNTKTFSTYFLKSEFLSQWSWLSLIQGLSLLLWLLVTSDQLKYCTTQDVD